MPYYKPPEKPFHNVNYTLTTANYHRIHYKQWGDKNFVPYLNKLYLFTEGQLTFTIDDDTFTATRGDILLLPLHTRQSYHATSSYFNHFYCHFLVSTNYQQLDLMDLIRCPYKISLSPEDYGWFVDQMTSLSKLYKGPTTYVNTLRCYDAFNRIILAYLGLCEEDIRSIEPKPYLSQMLQTMDYIQSNLHRQLTVDEIAHNLHLHPNYFIRLFKKHYGMAPIKYINTIKMKKACEQLLQGTDTIGHIARSLGYSDIYYFSKVFKKHMGVSPSSFRKKGI